MPCVCAVQVECEHQLEMERDRWVSVGVCGGVGVCFKIVFGGKAGGSVCVCMIVCGEVGRCGFDCVHGIGRVRCVKRGCV